MVSITEEILELSFYVSKLNQDRGRTGIMGDVIAQAVHWFKFESQSYQRRCYSTEILTFCRKNQVLSLLFSHLGFHRCEQVAQRNSLHTVDMERVEGLLTRK